MTGNNSGGKESMKDIMDNEDIVDDKDKINLFVGRFKEYLIQNPFSEVGIRLCSALNISPKEDEFFEKYYVDLYDKIDEDNGCDKSIIDDDSDRSEYNEIYNHAHDLRPVKSNLTQFEINVKDTTNSILAIKGTAGSGKTTYLNYLNYKYGNKENNKSNLFFHIINLSIPEKRIRFLASEIDFKDKVEDNIWVLTILLTKYISILINGNAEINFENIYANCKNNILVSYDKLFNDKLNPPIQDIKVEKFFQIFRESINNETENDIGTMLSAYLTKEFDCSSSGDALFFILQIIICLLLCFSRNGKRYICAIDNIEYLLKIENNRIINGQDIKTIVEKIIKADEYFKVIRNNLEEYQNCYSFILVTRIATYTFLKTAHDAIGDKQIGRLVDNTIVDTENTVRFEGIVEKRIEKSDFNKEDSKNNEYIDLFRNVLLDKTYSPWCMYSIISKFCNYNYRQVVQQLIDVISAQDSKEIKFFTKWWNYAIAYSTDDKENDKNRKSILKYLLRKNFLRMILSHYERADFFGKIMNEPQNIPLDKRTVLNSAVFKSKTPYSEYTFYTRKILNIISNYQYKYNKKISLSILFDRLIEYSISKSKTFTNLESDHILIERIDRFINIISTLGNATFEIIKEGNMAFGRCLNLDINFLEYTKENIKKHLLDELKYLQEKKQMDDYMNISEITLTSAGDFFAYILPDFELFSTRYLYADNSLFSRNSFFPIENRIKIEKITGVIWRKIKKSVKNILIDDLLSLQNGISHDLVEYNYMDGNNLCRNHSLRILLSHMGYLNNYIGCLENCIDDNFSIFPYSSDISVKIIEGAIKRLKNILNSYFNFIEGLTNGKYYIYIYEKNDSKDRIYQLEGDNFSDSKLHLIEKKQFDSDKYFGDYKPNRKNWNNLPKK